MEVFTISFEDGEGSVSTGTLSHSFCHISVYQTTSHTDTFTETVVHVPELARHGHIVIGFVIRVN